jgi:hypothetical protein
VVHADRRRGKTRARILYWFRTPPGVRVGRSALDEDAIRLIEAHNPGVAFDWTRILKGEGAAAPERRPKEDRRPRPTRMLDVPPVPIPPPLPEPVPVPAFTEPEPPEPVAAVAAEVDETPIVSPLSESTAAQARLGSEGLQRLRARHAEVLARISEKIQDSDRRQELKAQADRLNPDTWVTDPEVTAGLEQYEAVFESLRAVVGRRRRRRKRRGPGGGSDRPDEGPATGSAPGPEGDAEADGPGEDSGNEL